MITPQRASEPGRLAAASGLEATVRPSGERTRASPALVLLSGFLVAVMLAALTGLSVLGLHTFAIPFAATAALLATAPTSPLAGPRNVVVAYFASTVLALVLVSFLPVSTPTAAVVGSVAIVVMLLLRAAHPPALAGAVMIGLNGADWLFLLDGILPALAAILGIAVAAGALVPRYEYAWRWR